MAYWSGETGLASGPAWIESNFSTANRNSQPISTKGEVSAATLCGPRSVAIDEKVTR